MTKHVLEDEDKTFRWCVEKRLLLDSRNCPLCPRAKPMRLFRGVNVGLGRFECSAAHSRTGTKYIPIARNTWFENSRLSLTKHILLMYCFARSFTYQQTFYELNVGDDTGISDKTIADWFCLLREVCMLALDRDFGRKTGKIGGPGKIVEIDQSKIGKRKYKRGRLADGQWLIGLVEIEAIFDNYQDNNEDGNEIVMLERGQTGQLRLEILPDKSAETLIEIIVKHVEPGSIILTDESANYEELVEHGYRLYTVVPERDIAASDSGSHTHTLESALKRRICRGGDTNDSDNFALHLCEFLWRRECKRNNVDQFERIVEDIAYFYKHS